MQIEHPTKLDRLMQTVAEHHLLRGKLDVSLGGVRVRIESNSVPLLRELEAHFQHQVAEHRDELEARDLRIVAMATSKVDLGLNYERCDSAVQDMDRDDEFADIDGGRVVHKVGTGVQFLLGPDMTMAVGPCDEHKDLIIGLVGVRAEASGVAS